MIRVQKYLADAGIASRRKCEEYIAAGRVLVNGKIAEIGSSVDPQHDEVRFDGKPIKPVSSHVYIMLNKPAGCVSACSDDKGRKTVLDYVKDVPARIFPIGRLDYNTEGLLLLTNDGEFANLLMHPRHGVKKKYLTVIAGTIEPVDIRRLEAGVTIDGRKTAPSIIRVLHESPERTELMCIISEGRNRQIRKMFEAVDKQVKYIKRVGVGDLRLGDLKRGRYRRLSAAEIDELRKEALK